MGWKYKVMLYVELTTASLIASVNVRGQNPTEFQVKAVFVYNFVNFVEWPSSAFEQPSDPFVIGIAGHNVFGASLADAVVGETYRSRRIEIRYIENAAEAVKCHIVYIENTCDFFEQVLQSAGDKPILTIADTKDFMQKGGMIRFYLERNQLRMEINQRVASNRGLTISSKLLRLARVYNNSDD